MLKKLFYALFISILIFNISCKKTASKQQANDTAKKYPVTLITLDPGHFHAGLVQKTMYGEISPTVYVYAPAGTDLDEHLKRIDGYNNRDTNPTAWTENVYTGSDFFEKMLADKPGNVVVLAGNNIKKAQYIKACVDAGLNVFADKPMCIDMRGFDLLEDAFEESRKNGTIVYDIMTERSEITTILQRELMHNKQLFGELLPGSPDQPSIVEESVHHFFKYVSGSPLKRPAWFFDTNQQGEGIVDVTTHLIDLVMWECFPDTSIDYHTDVEVVNAKRRPTMITTDQFKKATGLEGFPDFLKSRVNDKGELACFANGEITFKVKGVFANVSVIWNFEAAQGAGDTHYSIARGTKANLIVKQGKEQSYRPELYIEPLKGTNIAGFESDVQNAAAQLAKKYEGVAIQKQANTWIVSIPDKYRIGHEAHFAQVTQRLLQYLREGKLPDWELSNMRAKYYITTKALEMAQK